MSRRATTTRPFPNPSPKIACSFFVCGIIELTRSVDRSTSNRRPIAVSSSVVSSPCNHPRPEIDVGQGRERTGLPTIYGTDSTDDGRTHRFTTPDFVFHTFCMNRTTEPVSVSTRTLKAVFHPVGHGGKHGIASTDVTVVLSEKAALLSRSDTPDTIPPFAGGGGCQRSSVTRSSNDAGASRAITCSSSASDVV
jgi:hypothetical protein